mgnify:CR=1 FL=1
MSKTLNVNSGNYKVKVPSGNTITLDTGTGVGNVQVTGNITIAGTQTVVNSQELDIVDNIITLNKGETGAGVTENTSGIQIDRGTSTNALMIFDEQTSFNDPVTKETAIDEEVSFKSDCSDVPMLPFSEENQAQLLKGVLVFPDQ